MDPVAADVNDHGHLKEKEPLRVEGAEGGQQGHGGAAIGQHVQHGAELGALVHHASGVPVKGVQETTQDVAEAWN